MKWVIVIGSLLDPALISNYLLLTNVNTFHIKNHFPSYYLLLLLLPEILFCCLTTLSTSRLCRVANRLIDI
jgi:hypothetical protein